MSGLPGSPIDDDTKLRLIGYGSTFSEGFDFASDCAICVSVPDYSDYSKLPTSICCQGVDGEFLDGQNVSELASLLEDIDADDIIDFYNENAIDELYLQVTCDDVIQATYILSPIDDGEFNGNTQLYIFDYETDDVANIEFSSTCSYCIGIVGGRVAIPPCKVRE